MLVLKESQVRVWEASAAVQVVEESEGHFWCSRFVGSGKGLEVETSHKWYVSVFTAKRLQPTNVLCEEPLHVSARIYFLPLGLDSGISYSVCWLSSLGS